MIDLQQIAISLRLATRRSLLIIDEFGKGTDSSDGAGLACGVFEHLLNRGRQRPKVLAATHYHGRHLVPCVFLKRTNGTLRQQRYSRTVSSRSIHIFNSPT